MPDDREAGFRSFLHQIHPVKLPGRVDFGEAGEVPEGLIVRVELVVDLGYVSFVGTEDGRKGAKLDPAQQEIFGAMILEKGTVYGSVAADVGVFEAVA